MSYLPNATLVDRRNISIIPEILDKIKKASLVGFDIETHNENALPGIKSLNRGKKTVFDIRRTVVTGFSIYCDDDTSIYYFNLNHKDIENRLQFHEVADIFKSVKLYVCHNKKFEQTMMKMTYGVDISPCIDTMQLAVTAYGPDNYDIQKFYAEPLGAMGEVYKKALSVFEGYNPEKEMSVEQAELMGQIAGKQSNAAHSYNGWVSKIAYGYNLKQAVKSFFGYKMEHYDEVLKKAGATHMGEVTGEQVVSYGCDDAYWCLQLYHKLVDKLKKENPEALSVFFMRENPVVDLYSKKWQEGVRLNVPAIKEKISEGHKEAADVLREIKKTIKELLPFKEEPCEALMCEKWYAKDPETYRKKLVEFATSEDFEDPIKQIMQINGGLKKSVSEDTGGIINLSHYMPQRTLFYDLMGAKVIKSHGKIMSNKDARGKILKKFEEGSGQAKLMELLAKLGSLDQVFKLYLTPYLNLLDPDTGRVYPELSNLLATRRMSMSNPNGQQLAKRGNTTYVRGFYLPDDDDSVIMSYDWSSVELVVIAELSRDPEFVACYSGEIYEDLHSVATAAMLGLSTEDFKAIKNLPVGTKEYKGVKFIDFEGNHLEPAAFYKFARVTIGKGANFSYWYSGALSTLAEKMGWSDEVHWEKVDLYRQRFSTAENWRTGTMNEAIRTGKVKLPDGLYRYRFEATDEWREVMYRKFLGICDTEGGRKFLNKFIKLQQTRAKNQSVNARIQGFCAGLLKTTWLKLEEEIKNRWKNNEVRVMFPIHDEIVASVRRDCVFEYDKLIREVMCNHPNVMKHVRLNCSGSIGRTFEPFNKSKAPYGQIELDEAPNKVDFIPEEFYGKKLGREQIENVLKYLFGEEYVKYEVKEDEDKKEPNLVPSPDPQPIFDEDGEVLISQEGEDE